VRSYHANLGAGISALVQREHDDPTPGAREVVVRVHASCLNRRETMIVVDGYYPLPIRRDVVPLSDGAGEVVAIGPGVTRVKIGDRVAGAVFAHWIDGPFDYGNAAQLGGSLDGMLTEYAVLDEAALVHIPDHLSFQEAATLPCAAVTAWNALTGARPLKAGETVLTLGTGGVSLFALQFAKMFGAQVIATTSNDNKANALRALGADHVVNYRASPEWYSAVREFTGGRGVDHIIEVGGPGTLEQSIKSAAAEAAISLVGWLARPVSGFDVRLLSAGVYTLRRIALGNRAQFEAMNRAVSVHRARPVIDRVFSFDEAREAFQYFLNHNTIGKVVIAHG
jgi:NADPH:quinone reductase-like Zn-dependent oxidoreductase